MSSFRSYGIWLIGDGSDVCQERPSNHTLMPHQASNNLQFIPTRPRGHFCVKSGYEQYGESSCLFSEVGFQISPELKWLGQKTPLVYYINSPGNLNHASRGGMATHISSKQQLLATIWREISHPRGHFCAKSGL